MAAERIVVTVAIDYDRAGLHASDRADPFDAFENRLAGSLKYVDGVENVKVSLVTADREAFVAHGLNRGRI